MAVTRAERPLALIRPLDAEGQDVFLGVVDGPQGEEVLARCVDDAQRRALRTRANALMQVVHPNLVPVLDLLERDDGTWVLEGGAHTGRLQVLLDHLATKKERASVELVLHVSLSLCEALHALHGMWSDPNHHGPLLHLAVSPTAVRLSRDGHVLLGKYDLLSRGVTDLDRLRYYGAPEQLCPGEEIGPTADLFSLGVVLFELLTNERAFVSEARPDLSERLDKVQEEDGAGLLFAPILRRLLSLDVAGRYGSAALLREALLPLWHHVPETCSLLGDAAPLFGAALDAETTGVSGAWMVNLDSDSAPEGLDMEGALDEDVEWLLREPGEVAGSARSSLKETPVTDAPPSWMPRADVSEWSDSDSGVLVDEVVLSDPMEAVLLDATSEDRPSGGLEPIEVPASTIIPGPMSSEGPRPRLHATARLTWWPMIGLGLLTVVVMALWLAS
ncbi:MAG: hypothetical protein KTR31_40675 [Myxococcales bacterium]|nr:hypothetical protein [Myxococcales bacterium]